MRKLLHRVPDAMHVNQTQPIVSKVRTNPFLSSSRKKRLHIFCARACRERRRRRSSFAHEYPILPIKMVVL
jgi:hypothetical protein